MLKNKVFSFSLLSLLICSACTGTVSEPIAKWQSSGSIVIAGPVPSVSTISSRAMLGFMPSQITAGKTWLSINSESKTLTLMRGNLPISTTSVVLGVNNLPKGHYEVALKQHDALWHASDEYYTNRKLEIPAVGSRERYLRGALGNSVLYLNEELAIHDSEIAIPEVGGIQVSNEDMNVLYEQLEVGSYIQVE